jgi:hypothetical protein
MESHFYGKTAKLSNGKRVEKKKARQRRAESFVFNSPR